MIVNILSLSISLLTCLITLIILRNIKIHLYYILNKPSKETIDYFIYSQKEIELPMLVSSSNDILKIESNYLNIKTSELFLCIIHDNYKGYHYQHLWINNNKQFEQFKTKLLNLYPKKKYIIKNKQILPLDKKETYDIKITIPKNKTMIDHSYIVFLLEKIEKILDVDNEKMMEEYNNIKQDFDKMKDYNIIKENIDNYIKKYNIKLS